MTRRSMFVAMTILLSAAVVQAQETLVFEAEDFTEPKSAWLKDKSAPDKWNLWSTDKDADKKWSKGVVLQSPVVQKDREKPEDGAPVLRTTITNIPQGTWRVTVKHGRSLAVSLDGKEWKDLSATGGLLGKFEIKDGKFELWVDDRFAHKASPGSSYYDCLTFTPVLAEKMGVANGYFEFGKELASSGWTWWSRDGKGSVEFSTEARAGKRCVKLQHDGERDWAFGNSGRLDVQPGQAWTASAWVKCQDTGGIELAIVALSKGQTMSWAIASDGVYGTKDWTRVVAAAQIPTGCDQIYLRFVGSGKTLAWVDDVAIQQGQETRKREPRPAVSGWAKTRVEEKLGRGMVAMPVAGGKAYLGWRLLKDDPKDVAFNVYRATGKQQGVKLNDKPLTTTTDFVDASPPLDRDNAYWVRPVVGGKELDPSEQALVPPKPEVKPHLSFKLKGDHTFQKAGIADLNGDGRYDFVIKQPNSNIDPAGSYWKPSPGPYKLEAYLHDGTPLWQKALGWAIEQGIWYSPYIVQDLDGDGKAEVAVKTGEGDPRDKDGRVQTGPEWLSILDGQTGQEKARVEWPSHEGFPNYNVASRNQICVAYLDGKTPCVVVGRGTYGTIKLVAYEFQGGRLKELWRWDNRDESSLYRAQGAHIMHGANIDPRYPGLECHANDIDAERKFAQSWTFSATGEQLAKDDKRSMSRTLFWDADLQKEQIRGSAIVKFLGGAYPGRIEGSVIAFADLLATGARRSSRPWPASCASIPRRFPRPTGACA